MGEMVMAENAYQSPADLIANLPWGTHGCHFYKTQKDLLDLLLPYMKAGLLNNEFCIWVTSKSLGVKDAARALKRVLPRLNSYLERGQIEIVPYTEWYLGDGAFESGRVLTGWIEKCNDALARGYDGLRLTGDTLWLKKTTWRNFADYEAALDRTTSQARIKAICTYSLDKCQAAEVIDVVKNHGYTLIKRGEWELIENAQRKRAEEQAREKALAELEKLVQSRTAELRALAAYLQSVREEERTRIARELHDEVGQALTGIKLSLERSVGQQFDAAGAELSQALALTNELMGRVRDLSLDLRPAMLDDLGLLAAFTWHFDRYTKQTNIQVGFKHSGLEGPRLEPAIETAAYRIIQEGLTNVARHGRVNRVEVDIRTDEKVLVIKIKDQGVGFDPDSLAPSCTGGLSGMRERAFMLGGRLNIESASGTGTVLIAELPLRKSTSEIENLSESNG
jgi:signal transduction histidine kinase